MKTLIGVLIVLVLLSAVATAQPDARLERVRGNAFWSDTVTATPQKIALQNVGRLPSLFIVNKGRLGPGNGYLYIGQISQAQSGLDARADTSTTASGGWMRALRIYADSSTSYTSFLIERCTADSLWLKSTDSVLVDIYQW